VALVAQARLVPAVVAQAAHLAQQALPDQAATAAQAAQLAIPCEQSERRSRS